MSSTTRRPAEGLRIIENLEPAARNHRRHVATAESSVSIGRKHRIRQNSRPVIIRVNWAGREFIRGNRPIRRERSRHNLINTNPSAGQRSIHSGNKSRPICPIRAVINRALLHRPAELSAPNDFEHIVHATPKFLFHISATGRKRPGN